MRTLNILKIGLIAFFLLTLGSCIEEEERIIPHTHVDIRINLSLPQYTALNIINNAIIIPYEGYNKNGVIVYRLNQEEFFAFDATCPQHVHTSTPISIDADDPGNAVCPHCHQVYILLNLGYTEGGHPLQRYRTSLHGVELRIYN